MPDIGLEYVTGKCFYSNLQFFKLPPRRMLLPHNPQCVIPETFKRSFTSFIHTAGVSISLLEIRKRKLNAIRSSLLLHIVMSPDHSPSSLQER